MNNQIELYFDSCPENEGVARVVASAFMALLDPTVEEVMDVKTAVSEAVTNAVIHGYGDGPGKIHMCCTLENQHMTFVVEDYGRGIENIALAMEPLYTSLPKGERSGMGFSFMEAFMDEVKVTSTPGKGTRVEMKKQVCGQAKARNPA